MRSTVQPILFENTGPICMIERWTVSSFILELMPTICENLHCLQIFTHIWQIINKIWHRLSQISDHHTQREASAISKGRYVTSVKRAFSVRKTASHRASWRCRALLWPSFFLTTLDYVHHIISLPFWKGTLCQVLAPGKLSLEKRNVTFYTIQCPVTRKHLSVMEWNLRCGRCNE